MNDISQKLKETLLGLIRNQDLSECVRAPDKDFARNRKLPYEKNDSLTLNNGGDIVKE
ncbi:MAG: hypothetical protein ACLTLQ_18415 [[Clostridium] scindens]